MYYLDYKDEKGIVRQDLLNWTNSMRKNEDFFEQHFFEELNKITMLCSINDEFKNILLLPRNSCNLTIGEMIYLFKKIINDPELDKSFEYLSKFSEYEFDTFMYVNYLKKIN